MMCLTGAIVAECKTVPRRFHVKQKDNMQEYTITTNERTVRFCLCPVHQHAVRGALPTSSCGLT